MNPFVLIAALFPPIFCLAQSSLDTIFTKDVCNCVSQAKEIKGDIFGNGLMAVPLSCNGRLVGMAFGNLPQKKPTVYFFCYYRR